MVASDPQETRQEGAAAESSLPPRLRFRLRYEKCGDLRWIGHQDLVRCVERWFRRAALPLRMSQGFHPKPKMNFLIPLAVGIAGRDEVMEFELAAEATADEVRAALERTAPRGLRIKRLARVTEGTPKPTMRRMTFELAVPEARQAEVARRIDDLLDTHPYPIDRQDGRPEFDLHESCGRLELADGKLQFDILATRSRSVRPRELLTALGIDDLEAGGAVMCRTAMEVT
ncbi:MAG: TIGR03936 family radical SAM-associated protein [Planctomycetales bacterium]|nr:TIGR03936 family radical SAM-associated protein [Planctomycetales bacterium]